MARISVVFLVIVQMFFATSALALGQSGHELVCQLAYEMLDQGEQQQVDRLIAAVPANEVKRLDGYQSRGQDDVPKRAMSFPRGCVWPDAIKRDDKYKKYNNWHFVNVDRDEVVVSANSCRKDCVTRAVPFHFEQLKSGKNDWQKAEALMFLGHWLGDIHQPLHVSFASDWGGNKIKMNADYGRCTALHWYWDTCLLESRGLDHAQLLAHFRHVLGHAEIMPMLNQDVYGWATESLTISRQPSVNYCQLQESGYCAEVKADENNPLTLAEDYAQQHWPQYEQQLVKASVRLAVAIKAALN